MNTQTKTIAILAILVILVSSNPLQNALAQEPAPQVSAAPTNTNVYIATEAGVAEKDPAVAVCASNQYLVVFEREGDIYGQRIAPGGALAGPAFSIFSADNNAFDPAVACDWTPSGGRFVVVFSYDYYGDGRDVDVYGRLVYENHQVGEDQFIGDYLPISQESAHETNPTVACNSDEDTCLVMFEYSGSGSGDIYGQRLNPNGVKLGLEGDLFQIVDNNNVIEGYPDITWSSTHARYLVTWQAIANYEDSHFRIMYSSVFDADQGAGNSQIDGARYQLYSPEESDPNYNAEHNFPSVAVNPQSGFYMFTFFVSNTSFTKSYVFRTNQARTIADMNLISNYANGRPAVAYSGGADALPGDKGKPEFMVAHTSSALVDYHALFTSCLPDIPDSNQYPIFIDVANTIYNSTGWYNSVDIAGSYHNGKYLVVYEEETYASGEYNIYGILIDPLNYVYLPMMVR